MTDRDREHILVTGAAGFIGSHLTDRLLDLGHRVTGVDNFDSFYSPSIKRDNLGRACTHSNFRLVRADCREIDKFEDAFGRDTFTAIVHLAAKAGVRPSIAQPLEYVRANVYGTLSMLEFARRHGVERFIFASSSSVYGNCPDAKFSETRHPVNPVSPYAASKVGAEALCHAYHCLYRMSVICLRFFTVYGPRQRPDLAIRKFATRMLHGDPVPVFGDGQSERDYTWIDDIIDGVTAAIERTAVLPTEYEVINLGESRTTSVQRLVELIGRAVGVTPDVLRAPPQPGDVRRTCADVSKAGALLGYRPVMPVEQGIPRFVQWLRQHEGVAPRMSAVA